MEEKRKIFKSKRVASLETNSQLRNNLSRVKEELSHSVKCTYFSKILFNMSHQSINGKKGLGCRPKEPPYNPHRQYVFVADNLLCTHCGRNSHLKERFHTLRRVK